MVKFTHVDHDIMKYSYGIGDIENFELVTITFNLSKIMSHIGEYYRDNIMTDYELHNGIWICGKDIIFSIIIDGKEHIDHISNTSFVYNDYKIILDPKLHGISLLI